MSRRRTSRYLRLGAALCAAGCSNSAKPAPATTGPDPWEGHPPHPSRPPPPGGSATALRAAYRERLTTVRVSAHVGSVILRKRGASWVVAGNGGCTVPARRIDRALDALERLEAVKTDEQPRDGKAFELQIVALMDEELALQLEIASAGDHGDLVQLFDGSRVRMRGLDRSSWSARPADWCNEP